MDDGRVVMIGNDAVRRRPFFEAGSYPVVGLSDPEDRVAVTQLSAACADYAVLVSGVPPTPQDGEAFLNDAPPGHALESMLKLGICDEHNPLVGVIDGLAAFARTRSVTCLRLGVVEANVGAQHFWHAISFREIRRVPDRRIGERNHTVIEFIRRL